MAGVILSCKFTKTVCEDRVFLQEFWAQRVFKVAQRSIDMLPGDHSSKILLNISCSQKINMAGAGLIVKDIRNLALNLCYLESFFGVKKAMLLYQAKTIGSLDRNRR